MERKLFITLVALAALPLSGCIGPKAQEVPKDLAAWESHLKPALDKLSADDRRLFLGYWTRIRIGTIVDGKSIDERLTIGQVIDRQKAWLHNEVKKEVEARLTTGRFETERAVLAKVGEELLAVNVLELKRVKNGYVENQVFRLGFRNKGQKDIAGIQGRLRFLDIFDTDVGSIGVSYTNELKAGESATWSGSRRYNPYLASHKSLASLEHGKYISRFEPEMIVFSDGQKLLVRR